MANNRLDLKIDTYSIKNTLMNFIVPLVCIGITIGLGLLIIYPSFKNLPVLKSQLQDKEQSRTQLENKKAALNKLTDFKPVLEENLSLVDRVLVSEANVPYLLNQVDQIARGSGLNVMRLNYAVGGAAESSKGDASMIVVNLGVDGNYDQMIVFLESLEKAARLIDVSNYRYSLNSESDTGSLGLSFLLISPYLSVSSTASTDDSISLDMASMDFVNTINLIKTFRFYETAPSRELLERAEETPIEDLLNESEAPETTPSEPVLTE